MAALDRFAAKGLGFTEVSIAELAAEAGLARSTFYVYFGDKGELAVGLAQRVAEELQVVAGPAWDFAEQMSRAELRRAIGGVIELYRSHAAVYSALAETASYDPKAKQVFHAAMGSIIARTVKLVQRCQDRGWGVAGPRAEIAAALVWMVERTCQELPLDADQAASDRAADAATAIVWQSLFAGTTSSG